MRCLLPAGALLFLVALLPACHSTSHPSAANPAPATPAPAPSSAPANSPTSQSAAGDGSVDKYPEAGVGGYGEPTCLYCPQPLGSDEMVGGKHYGATSLRCLVGPEGSATHITVVKSLGKEFDESAVKTVSQWRFKPATGPDGKPAAVWVLIEVTRRLP